MWNFARADFADDVGEDKWAESTADEDYDRRENEHAKRKPFMSFYFLPKIVERAKSDAFFLFGFHTSSITSWILENCKHFHNWENYAILKAL